MDNHEDLDLTHKVREKIYLKIKDMPPEKILEYIKSESKKLTIPFAEDKKNISLKDYLNDLRKKAS